jgi:DNA-3-methyladenine glycosylase
MHFCFNVVCGEVNQPLAVLIRALEPAEGLDVMRLLRRGEPDPAEQGKTLPETALCSGPAKLCQALAIDRSLNGIDLTRDPQLFIERARKGHLDDNALLNTPRIGVDYAGSWASKKLRWFLRSNPHVSRARLKSIP